MKKIPDNAKKVFEGLIFDVYHWDQEMFDGSFATFEAVKRKDSASVIAIVDNKIIVNHEEQPMKEPFLTIPGGNIEQGTPLLGAQRELLEETGYASNGWREWFVSDPSTMTKLEWNNYFFIARNCQKVKEQELDPGEKIEVTLVTFEEFLELRHNPKFRNKDLVQVLEKAAGNEEEKQKLKELFGIKD
jgi:ADP-ribose pyrophosphatase